MLLAQVADIFALRLFGFISGGISLQSGGGLPENSLLPKPYRSGFQAADTRKNRDSDRAG